ncbi:TetR/AcrR family transcriptional regulator [Luteipulveratus sp. YIM 133132]|uniref:TetR/AcrR family transcriptional regulator n=1 Tax=Luteipulveratus flavus TaxID=3031728 RepID=UPI0023B0F17A|nr:TetR/AcrR family transcriptional regulator [Luteipulveratus sp. YIM 133132]MDE9364447.1 TetR/AcrR family transcriptional regulator [Luteipulveratus sp. YIM 133132]
MTEALDPFGAPIRRSARLSDQETADRMLDTAVGMVNESGLQVSYGLLRLEDVIAAAGVSRSAVYRRWPTKNHFFADLMKRLAGEDHPGAVAYDTATIEQVTTFGLEHLDWFTTPGDRRKLLVELCRQGALQNFEAIVGSPEWHIYIALNATVLSLPDNELEHDMRAALGSSEEAFVAKMTTFYEAMVGLLGFRLRDDAIPGATYRTLTTLGASVVEGLSINTISTPEVASTRFTADPFDTGLTAEWSLPALGYTGVALTLLEPDETQGEWDRSRLEAVRELLARLRDAA